MSSIYDKYDLNDSEIEQVKGWVGEYEFESDGESEEDWIDNRDCTTEQKLLFLDMVNSFGN